MIYTHRYLTSCILLMFSCNTAYAASLTIIRRSPIAINLRSNPQEIKYTTFATNFIHTVRIGTKQRYQADEKAGTVTEEVKQQLIQHFRKKFEIVIQKFDGDILGLIEERKYYLYAHIQTIVTTYYTVSPRASGSTPSSTKKPSKQAPKHVQRARQLVPPRNLIGKHTILARNVHLKNILNTTKKRIKNCLEALAHENDPRLKTSAISLEKMATDFLAISRISQQSIAPEKPFTPQEWFDLSHEYKNYIRTTAKNLGLAVDDSPYIMPAIVVPAPPASSSSTDLPTAVSNHTT